ncbi:MAG: CDP-alcohol phosphatidyltransferase family protein [Clostridia bacterium]|nr:CDP-alcohol phosphatidyltransferase family protein [Clostridia bacterium]
MVESKYKNKILTIPNILSFIRIAMIPIIINLYIVRENYVATAGMVLLSALTDIADGFIARHFNMISDFGKAFDPIADKLTQFVIMICLTTRFRYMIVPVILITLKEIFAGITALMTIKKTQKVVGADWHGKLTTILIYSMMILHILWTDIPSVVSNILITASVVMMLLSAVLYAVRNIKMLKNKE